MRKKCFWITAAVVVLLVLLLVALPFFIDVDRFRPEIEAALERMIGRQVNIGRLELSILRGDLKATDISIADDPAFRVARSAKGFLLWSKAPLPIRSLRRIRAEWSVARRHLLDSQAPRQLLPQRTWAMY